MTMLNTRWKIILTLVAVVLISGLAGGVIGTRLTYARIHRHNTPQTWNESVMRALQHRLRLTPEQTQKVQARMDARVDELTALREETVAKANGIIEQLVADVDREITPEQKVEFEKLKKQREQTTLDTLKVQPRKK